MFSQDLKIKYPNLTEYFERGLNNEKRNLAHSILFYGTDIEAQYGLATEIARLLNCKEFRNDSCQCLNCRWAREGKHPAIMTISKIDNKPSDDDSKTVISIKQAQMVKNHLVNTSEYHRVFIFCDAIKDKNDNWHPLGLNRDNFQDETANALLKTIEEPPKNTTFFFLTRDKNDLISTIISRSQSFFVPSFSKEGNDYNLVKDIFEQYPNLNRQNAFSISQQVVNLAKENGEDLILNQIQNYFGAVLKSNIQNQMLKNKVIKDIKAVEKAKYMIKSHIQPQVALDDMLLNITKSL